MGVGVWVGSAHGQVLLHHTLLSALNTLVAGMATALPFRPQLLSDCNLLYSGDILVKSLSMNLVCLCVQEVTFQSMLQAQHDTVSEIKCKRHCFRKHMFSQAEKHNLVCLCV